ncbi:uracil-DNA glycosylase family protein [Streptomyces sp. L500]
MTPLAHSRTCPPWHSRHHGAGREPPIGRHGGDTVTDPREDRHVTRTRGLRRGALCAREGRPFVGPAGGVLDRALGEAGIDPEGTYVTNAVKHFTFEPARRGKRRIHKAPDLKEIRACKPWLAEELRLVAPEVVVALGATAGKALFGSSFRVGKQRGLALPLPALDGSGEGGGTLVATIHPSAVLRAADEERVAMYAGLVADLKVAARLLG